MDSPAPPATPELTAGHLAAIIRRHRYRYANETELQTGIAAVLADAGVNVRREVRLSDRDRIDLFTPAGIGIEVKVDGQHRDVWRQLRRYAATGQLRELLLVTTRARHVIDAATHLGPVPVTVLLLRGGL